MAGDIMVTVPYDDFILGVTAQVELENIRVLLANGEYASKAIFAVLGIEVNDDAGAD